MSDNSVHFMVVSYSYIAPVSNDGASSIDAAKQLCVKDCSSVVYGQQLSREAVE